MKRIDEDTLATTPDAFESTVRLSKATKSLSKASDDDQLARWLIKPALGLGDLLEIESMLMDNGNLPVGASASALAEKLRQLGGTLSGSDANRAHRAALRLDRQAMI